MCNANVQVDLPSLKYDYKTVIYKCGAIDPFGDVVLCDKCSGEQPWYMCPHGIDLNEREMSCNLCNAENE